jgi:hypothetical protein
MAMRLVLVTSLLDISGLAHLHAGILIANICTSAGTARASALSLTDLVFCCAATVIASHFGFTPSRNLHKDRVLQGLHG